MERKEYMLECADIAKTNHSIVVVDGEDTTGRPFFRVVRVLHACSCEFSGKEFYGIACVDLNTQDVKLYLYYSIVGCVRDGEIWLDGLKRCLSFRYNRISDKEYVDTFEIVKLMIGEAG